MSRESFYRVIIIALLVLNFGILGFLWMGRHGDMPPGRRPEPAGFIIEKLQLDDAQQARFQQLRNTHHKRDMELREESRNLHDALFSLLKNEAADSAKIDNLYNLISVNDRAKEQLNFNHFKELKTILKPEQQKLYQEFIEDIAKQFGPPPPHGGRP